MSEQGFHVVTGAFGYSGKYIARSLLEAGHAVHTLTNSSSKADPFQGRVPASPFHFDDPPQLVRALQGAKVLYNTYWVRFNTRAFTHEMAVRNTITLFRAAREAGVERIVHVSITNPSEGSPYEYFRGKARLEGALRELGVSYAILRPAVIFGGEAGEDILLNNIAWALRRFPVFGLFGRGLYSLQPIHVLDLAELAYVQGEMREDITVDAIGPETFTYRGLVETVIQAIGQNRLIVPLPPSWGYLMGWLIGRAKGDIFITWPEIKGLMANLLTTSSAPTGSIKLSEWVYRRAATLGVSYSSELARR